MGQTNDCSCCMPIQITKRSQTATVYQKCTAIVITNLASMATTIVAKTSTCIVSIATTIVLNSYQQHMLCCMHACECVSTKTLTRRSIIHNKHNACVGGGLHISCIAKIFALICPNRMPCMLNVKMPQFKQKHTLEGGKDFVR